MFNFYYGVNMEHFLWVEKYRPNVVADCILPLHIKSTFQEIVNKGQIPNLLLCGGPGMGKTTIAKAMCNELDCSYMLLNSSDERGIDVLRTKMKTYASAKSLDGSRKVLILDEADHLTPDAQAAMRGFMEDFAINCSFILTCNYKNRIIDAIHSRCSTVEFSIQKTDKEQVIKDVYRRISFILNSEKVTFKPEVVGQVILNFFPDFRKTINELQKFASNNKEINEGVLRQFRDANLTSLFKSMKDKNFTQVREWVVNNSDADQQALYRKIYDSIGEHIAKQSVPQSVICLADYQYKANFSVDPEICLLACLTELMVNLIWN